MLSDIEQDLMVATGSRIVTGDRVCGQHKVWFARTPIQLERAVIGLQAQVLPTRICVEIVRWANGTEMPPVTASSAV